MKRENKEMKEMRGNKFNELITYNHATSIAKAVLILFVSETLNINKISNILQYC